MFSDNDQISIRQVFRLFAFDFIGGSTLVLPARLSALAGVDGILSILLGGGIASLYLCFLGMGIKRMDSDYLSFLQQSVPVWIYKGILFLLTIHCVLVAGDAAYIFADVMKRQLVTGESFGLILALILLVASYAVYGGVESRARVYEVLFWIIFLPLFLMMLLAARDVDLTSLTPFFSASISSVGRGSVPVVFCLLPLFLVLFFPAYVGKEKRGKMVSAVLSALWFALAVLLGLYVILVGNFGTASLASMRYPVITLMSSIELRGSFLKRFDAFMIGIWFFTLFALVNVFMFYGNLFLQKLLGCQEKKARGAAFGGIFVLVYVLAMHLQQEGSQVLFTNYMRFFAMPFLVLLPVPLFVWGKGKVPGEERRKE